MENVGCDRSETGNEPRHPRSAHQTPASGLQLLQCCTRTPAADGLRVSATNHKASPIPRGVHLKRTRTTVASFTIFFSTRSNDDTRQRLAFSTPTHPPTISIRHPPPHRSQQTDDCRGPKIHVPCFSGFCRVLGRIGRGECLALGSGSTDCMRVSSEGKTPTSPSTPTCGYLLRSLVYLHYPHVVGVDQSSPSPDTLSRCFCRAVGFW